MEEKGRRVAKPTIQTQTKDWVLHFADTIG